MSHDGTRATPDAAAELAAIVESSEDAIISKDLNGLIRTWNAAAERVYGYTASEAIGKPMSMLLPPDRQREEADILARLRAGERVEHFETTRVRKDGRTIHVSLTISPVHGEGGKVLGASHVARDITQRRYFEEQLRQTQRLESLGVLAGGIAHDFNNLLTGILGNASIMGEILPPSNPAHTMLREITGASQRLSDLTRQLLAYAGKATFSLAPLNISELVREISSLIRSSIPKDVQLRLQLDEELPPIKADASQIQQVVMNLIINGAEAIPVGQTGTVNVTTTFQVVDEQMCAPCSRRMRSRRGRTCAWRCTIPAAA
jgi:PAS domain S-box-containing protein